MNPKARLGVIVLCVAVIAIVIAVIVLKPSAPVTSTEPIAIISYACNEGKTISASYFEGAAKPAVGDQPPIPGGSVALDLSDGRAMTLMQTLSADGTRYANADESFVFWSKGNGALILENNQEKSFIGCVRIADKPAGSNLSQVYSNGQEGFSIRLGEGYTTDASYRYQALGPGKDIAGIKFTIPSALAAGTNLSSDSYLSVEEIPQVHECTPGLFLPDRATAVSVNDAGSAYIIASTTGAAAGNRYEETIYAIPGTNPCMAIRYFVHYGVIENYPAGTVKEFDRAALLAEFDAIRRTLVVSQ